MRKRRRSRKKGGWTKEGGRKEGGGLTTKYVSVYNFPDSTGMLLVTPHPVSKHSMSILYELEPTSYHTEALIC
jgi:hypothetical protein